MKKMILYDHTGQKLMEHDVFVEGQDFIVHLDKPTAFWLGSICLVDKELEPIERVGISIGADVAAPPIKLEEEKVESKTVDNQSTGDSRIGEASEPESTKALPEQPAGGEPTKRGKRARKRKTA